MNLKTSLFSKTLIKSDLKRYWWLSVLNFLSLLLFSVYPVFERIGYRYSPTFGTGYKSSILYRYTYPTYVIVIGFSLFSALLVFSYLNNGKSVSFVHGLPKKRITNFISHTTSGLILTLLPAVVTALIFLVMRFNPDIMYAVSKTDIMYWLYTYIVYMMLAYFGSVFCCLLTGNAFATIGATAVISLTPVVVTAFVETLLQENLYGYYGSSTYDWLNYVYIQPLEVLSLKSLIYWGLSLLLGVLAYVMYKKRHLENHGEVIAFPRLKPVFIGVIAVWAGILGYMYCVSVSGASSLLWILPFGILGIIIAFMLSKKAFTLKGVWKPLGIFTAVFAIFFCVIKFDLTGFERRIPALSKIDGVLVGDYVYNSEESYFIGGDIGQVKLKETYNPTITKKEDIENVRRLHKYMIENREFTVEDSLLLLPISYKLSNGKELKRYYQIPREECREFLKQIYETQEMKYAIYTVANPTKKDVINVRVKDTRKKGNEFISVDKVFLDEITEAFCQDIENLKYEDNYEVNRFVLTPSTRISFAYTKPATKANGYDLTEEEMKLYPHNVTYHINKNYVNTMGVLNRIGFFDDLYTADEIVSAGVRFYDNSNFNTEQSYVTPVNKTEKDVEVVEKLFEEKITDSSEITELYEFVTDVAIYDTNIGDYTFEIYFKTNTDKMIINSLQYKKDKIPELLKKYIK